MGWKARADVHTRHLMVALLVALGLTCDFSADPEELSSIVFGVEHDYGVLVLDGQGRVHARLKAEWRSKDQLETGYFAPDVSPDGTQIAFVSCHDLRREHGFFQSRSKAAGGCRLRVKDLESGREEEILHADDLGLDSPVWSPNGERLAVLEGRKVLILELGSDRVNALIVKFMLPARPWSGGSTRSGYLRWSADGNRLYLLADRDLLGRQEWLASRADPPERSTAFGEILSDIRVGGLAAIGVIEVGSLGFEWSTIEVPTFVGGRYSHHYLETQQISPSDGVAHLVKRPMPDDEAVAYLFGSAGHPVWRPTRKFGTSYYFHVASNSGLLSRLWVEGHDSRSGKTFEVRTLERYLYTK